MLDAIIFDMDGLLIDSEVVWNDVRVAMAAARGVTWNEADHRAVMGAGTRTWVDYMIARLELDLTPEEVQKAVVDRMMARYAESIPLRPGALHALDTADALAAVGVASGSTRELLRIVTTSPPFRGRFRQAVSADEVAAGKPAPDVYLEAARRLGVRPETCVCLEDSGHGIAAGRAAGMKVIAVPDPRFSPPPEALAEADRVLDSLEEITADTFLELAG